MCMHKCEINEAFPVRVIVKRQAFRMTVTQPSITILRLQTIVHTSRVVVEAQDQMTGPTPVQSTIHEFDYVLHVLTWCSDVLWVEDSRTVQLLVALESFVGPNAIFSSSLINLPATAIPLGCCRFGLSSTQRSNYS